MNGISWRVIVCVVVASMLIGAITPALVGAAGPTADEVMQAIFAKHSDFPCASKYVAGAVKAPGADTMARIPELDAFAKERSLDADKVVCFGWTWWFDRDQNAGNTNTRKGHYVARGGINDYDRKALRASDINEMIYELGGQPAYREIDDSGRPVPGHWALYPMRWLAGGGSMVGTAFGAVESVASFLADISPIDPFVVTLGAFLAWLVAGGLALIIGWGMGFLFPGLDPNLSKVIQGGVVVVLTALLTYVIGFIPQTILDKTLFDFAVFVIGAITTWIGTLAGGVGGAVSRVAAHDAHVRMQALGIVK